MSSYQALHDRTYRQIEKLTAEGKFEGHQAARTVLVHFAMSLSTVDNIDRGLKNGYVMEGVITVPVIAARTGLNKGTVSRAITWLRAAGYIEVQHIETGGRRYIGSVKVTLPQHLKLVASGN